MVLPKYAYFKNQFVPYSEAKVGVLTHGFNYGTAVFGGLRAYWNPEEEQLFVFRPMDHYRRFINSARLLMMELDQTPNSLTEIMLELLNREAYHEDIYIRPIAYKSDETIGVRLHDLKNEFTIVAFPFDKYIKNDTDVHAMFSSWRRIDDNVIPARGKISGAYVNSALIKTEAVLAGFEEALVLTQDGHVSEGSAMNVFIIRGDMIITPPVYDNILEGITRKSAIDLLQNEMGLSVIERSIDRTEVYLADECFMTGSAAQIIAVTNIDHRPIGKGVMGPITGKLRSIFNDLIRGRIPKYHHWTTPVYHEVVEQTLR